MKFQFNPTKNQRNLFRDYGNCSNYLYNKTINFLKSFDFKSKLTDRDLRDMFVTSETRKYSLLWNKCNRNKTRLNKELKELEKNKTIYNIFKLSIIRKKLNNTLIQYKILSKLIEPEINNNLKSFELNVHKDVRFIAVKEAYTRWKTNIDLVLSKKRKFFKMDYKTKKKLKNNYNFGISQAMFKIKDNNIILTNRNFKNEDKIIKLKKKSKKSLYKIKSIKDAKITHIKGKFYIYLCVDLKETNISSKPINNVVGLDPGINTFLNAYGTTEFTKFQQSNLLDKLNAKIDLLKSNHKRKNAITKIETKKKNLVNELHWKTINYLCKQNDIICIEHFTPSKVGESKNISKKSKRRMFDLRHFEFRQRLIYKAENQGIEVIVTPAKYTSKYCSSCGNIKHNLKLCDRIYNCDNCNLSMCRDLNASKNILMFGLSKKFKQL